MKILVVGSGGREHAIVHALSRSLRVSEIIVAPGNAGTALQARNAGIPVSDLDGLSDLAENEGVSLTVVGPEQPLVDGIVDLFRERGQPVVGPSAAAARLEGSKAFAKAFMDRHGIPTAAFRTFTSAEVGAAHQFVEELGAPVVVKASGLAAGKGAIVCNTVADASSAIQQMLVDRLFGDAGDKVIVEEFMVGQEASLFALCDGSDFVMLSTAQDHKRVGEGDTGPNTGGMGAYAPAVILDDETLHRAVDEIIRPTITGMVEEGHPYTGFLYAGIMLTTTGPRVVEFNCRLGDPEAQVVLPLLKSDFADLLQAAVESRLGGYQIEHHDGSAACVVLCSGGYPGSYKKGVDIEGIGSDGEDGVTLIHAGTSLANDRVVTSGGRVLGVTAVGRDLGDALARAYDRAAGVSFEGMFYRRDIGHRGLTYLGGE
jgi:phosphoribosylamine--glycine ligase